MLTTYELPVKSHSTVSLNNQPLFQRLALQDNYWNELRSVNADSVWEAAAAGALPSFLFILSYDLLLEFVPKLRGASSRRFCGSVYFFFFVPKSFHRFESGFASKFLRLNLHGISLDQKPVKK